MRNRPIPPPSRRGFMLLIVTLVLTALTLSGAALLTLMKTENEATSTRGRKELTHGVVRSAVVYLVGCVEQTEEEREKLERLIKLKDRYNLEIMLDGACTIDRIRQWSKKGVDGFVLGTSSLFGRQESYKTIMDRIKRECGE